MQVITDATVVPMDRRGALAHHDVLVDGGAIVDVMPTGGSLPDGSTTIDGSGLQLIPGLIDAHAHFADGVDDRLVDDALLDLYLISGSTSVLCLKGEDNTLEAQRRITAGAFGPTIFSSGPLHDEDDLTYEQGRAAAHHEAEQGFIFIKVYNELSIEGYRGLTDGAREAGIRMLGHVPRKPGLEGVFASGQCSIVHAEELLFSLEVDGMRGGPLHFSVKRVP
jgi:cytosine/adenosine deaminase-related metal-dependent hydrolase